VLLALWAVLACIAVYERLQPEVWVRAGLYVIASYFLVIGLLPQRRA
jgi:hypothetical protein